MKASVFIVLAISVSCALTSSANAQGGSEKCDAFDALVAANRDNPSALWWWSSTALPLVDGPSNVVCCNQGGALNGELCIAPRQGCKIPSNVADTVCLNCSKKIPITPAQAGHPINLATGNTYISQSDISVPGLGGGLALSRIWNSRLPATQSAYPFMFGPNWRSNYEEHLLFNDGNGFLDYVRADGSIWYFGVASLSPNVYKVAAPAIDTSTTITEGSPNWTLTFKDGEKRQFDATTGALAAIVDRNGNTTTLTYDASNRLASVTDAAGRHLDFSYGSSGSNLVTGVSSDVGISLSYTYDAQGRLNVVTKPDNTKVSFDYDTNSMITAVRDNEGKVLESHTYDVLKRGLSSSRANGVDSVTITYP